jgi:hypothetical protein
MATSTFAYNRNNRKIEINFSRKTYHCSSLHGKLDLSFLASSIHGFFPSRCYYFVGGFFVGGFFAAATHL